MWDDIGDVSVTATWLLGTDTNAVSSMVATGSCANVAVETEDTITYKHR